MTAYTCVIHFEATNIEERVILFSETTFERVKDCTEKWASLACQQGDVARRQLQQHRRSGNTGIWFSQEMLQHIHRQHTVRFISLS